jgi:hypothetical protein
MVKTVNPFFSVGREKLNLASGKYTGHDAIYREDNGEPLSVVSEGYNIITHREAVDFVHHTLDSGNIDSRQVDVKTTPNGGKMIYTITLPGRRFNAADIVPNTAEGDPQHDDFDPSITIGNSYDKTHAFFLAFGFMRLICTNGLYVGKKFFQMRVPHTQHVDFDEIRPKIISFLEQTGAKFKQRYIDLNHLPGHITFTEILKQEMFAKGIIEKLIQRMSMYEDVRYDKTSKGDLVIQEIKQRREYTAYLLMNALTWIASHKVKGAIAQHNLNQQISEVFM